MLWVDFHWRVSWDQVQNWRWSILISKNKWTGFHSGAQKVLSKIAKSEWQNVSLLLLPLTIEILTMHSPYKKRRIFISSLLPTILKKSISDVWSVCFSQRLYLLMGAKSHLLMGAKSRFTASARTLILTKPVFCRTVLSWEQLKLA